MSERLKPSDATWRDLIGQATSEDAERPLKGARLVRLDLVDPNPAQARQVFDEAALAELAESIRTQGVIQPVVLRRVGDRYQVVAGERRTRAARMAALEVIPAIIRDVADDQGAIITAMENLQRADLDIEDEIRQLQTLMRLTGLSGNAVGKLIGKTGAYVSEHLAALQRPDLLAAYRAKTLTWKQVMAQLRTDPNPMDPQLLAGITAGPDSTSAGQTPAPEVAAERAELDTRSSTANRTPSPHQGAAPDATLQRTPWRDRPLNAFMDWIARVDTENLAAQERAAALRQVAEARAWLNRLEERLADGVTE